jgi:DNA invertase Pin-like site-specific DNA recombinase
LSTRTKLIGYIRVSTKDQGESGLGLEGQEAAIHRYVSTINGQLITIYVEVETGKKYSIKNRPQLMKALSHAKRARAVLVIAKLDRLSRNVAFLSGLMESGVDFVACDNPTANRLTIHILAAVAENEAKMISERTRAALAAYKARGGVLGAARPECRENLKQPARVRGATASGVVAKELADDAYSDLVPQIREWRASGLSLPAIARRLNAEGHTTRRGRPWNHVQVLRTLRRFAQ